jgi:hypothetical protein
LGFPDVPKTKPAKDRKRFRVFGPTFVIRPKSIETNLSIVTFGTRFKNITSFKARSGSKSEKEQQRSKKKSTMSEVGNELQTNLS